MGETAVVEVHGCHITSRYDTETDTEWSCISSWCDELGIGTWNQIKKLRENPLYQGFVINHDIMVNESDAYGGWRDRRRGMWFIHNRMLMTWLCSIQSRRVLETLRGVQLGFDQDCCMDDE